MTCIISVAIFWKCRNMADDLKSTLFFVTVDIDENVQKEFFC